MEDTAPDQRSDAAPRSSSGPILLVAVIVLLALFLARSRQSALQTEGELLGRPLPPLNVAGWLNTDGPPQQDGLQGRVVLLDFWASWCGPCRAEMPHVVETYKRFSNQGLVLIGLTPESGAEVDDAKKYIASVNGLIWPIGFGADLPIEMLNIEGFPTLVLFDKTGKSVWASHSTAGLEDAITDALAAGR